MNVQLSSSGIGHGALTGTGKARPVDAATLGPAKSAPSGAARRHASAARRTEFAAQQEHVNRQVTYAQRSIVFIEQTLASLQELKAALSGSAGRGASASSNVQASLDRVQAQWQTRHGATGGALGPDLVFDDQGSARQSFRVHALTLEALQNERAEVLTVYPRGAGKPSVSLPIDGRYRSDHEWARRVDYALAASGINASVNEERELAFDTQESRWPELQQHLMIQGNGHRFPGGRPSRAQAEAIKPPIDPSAWQIGNAAERRQTLRSTVHALDHLQQVRESLDRMLAHAHSAIRPDRDVQTGEAAQIAATFDAMLEQTNDFQRFTTIGAALRGLNDYRVRSVIG
ncbi:hypothetical protein ISP15_09135 [Dyella jejuensis]|uniref:Flagellin n=1 Tax=Dyella jejuensis TaxID=1432009 RepID=A0ABW8JHC7_9GAMM